MWTVLALTLAVLVLVGLLLVRRRMVRVITYLQTARPLDRDASGSGAMLGNSIYAVYSNFDGPTGFDSWLPQRRVTSRA
jgi:hypothetical protein